MAKVIRIYEQGDPEVMRFEEVEVGAPGPGEVRVKIDAIGLNRSEAMFRAGRYPVPAQLPCLCGYEAAGRVEALGDSVDGFAIGDRVSIIPNFRLGTYGVWGEQAIVPASSLIAVPDGLSQAEAASIWMQYFTALAIIEVGDARMGDHVLIRAASSSVGIAAIQLANWAGAVSIAATRSSAKADALKALGAAHVVATDEVDLGQEVMRISGGRGAQVAFDPVGGPDVNRIAEAMGERGIILQYGGLSEQPTPFPHWLAAFKALSVRGWIASEIWGKPERFARYRDLIVQGLALGRLTPVIARTFAFDDMAEAHRYLESNRQIGKIVVTVA